MLGKLFKHEFREIGRLLGPLNLALILIAFLGNIILRFESRQFGFSAAAAPPTLLSSLISVIYTLTIFTLFILTAVYLTVRFYKTMYGNRGYLTHTLPVSTISVLNVKLLVAAFWLIAAFVIGMISLFFLVTSGETIDFHIYFPTLKEKVTGTDIYAWTFLLMIAIMLLAICFSTMLTVCASLAVGQLFHQFRIAAAIGAYVVFYTI